jgi:hypothetical protein
LSLIDGTIMDQRDQQANILPRFLIARSHGLDRPFYRICVGAT